MCIRIVCVFICVNIIELIAKREQDSVFVCVFVCVCVRVCGCGCVCLCASMCVHMYACDVCVYVYVCDSVFDYYMYLLLCDARSL